MITYGSNCPAPLRHILNDFDRLMESFINKGWFEDHGWHDPAEEYEINQVPDPSRRHIMKIIARNMKRPFIRATYRYRSELIYDANGKHTAKDGVWLRSRAETRSVTFVVPRRKYLSPIINPLMLVAKPASGQWFAESEPVSTWKNTSNLYFFFQKEEGIALWDEMSEQFTTREEMRAALKLPPLTNE